MLNRAANPWPSFRGPPLVLQFGSDRDGNEIRCFCDEFQVRWCKFKGHPRNPQGSRADPGSTETRDPNRDGILDMPGIPGVRPCWYMLEVDQRDGTMGCLHLFSDYAFPQACPAVFKEVDKLVFALHSPGGAEGGSGRSLLLRSRSPAKRGPKPAGTPLSKLPHKPRSTPDLFRYEACEAGTRSPSGVKSQAIWQFFGVRSGVDPGPCWDAKMAEPFSRVPRQSTSNEPHVASEAH